MVIDVITTNPNIKPGDRISWLINGTPAKDGKELAVAVVVAVTAEGAIVQGDRLIRWDNVTMPW